MKEKILVVYDVPNWCFHSHAKEIQKRLSDKFSIDIVDHRQNINELSNKYDLVYVLDPMPINYPPKEKTILGLRAEWFYTMNPKGAIDTYNNGFHCASIKDKCCMFHVVNKRMFEIFKPIVLNKPLLLVQHGVDETIFDREKHKKSRNNEFTIGISGRVDSPNKKGFDIIDSVCKRIGVKYITTKYRATKYEKGARLTKEQMPDFYRQIDVYACLSQTEGLNNPTLESGAMGIPVISTRSGAAEEMIKDKVSGLLIDRNEKSFVEALEFMRDNEKQRLEMGENFYKEIMANWTWKTKIKEYENMFDMFFKMNGDNK